MDSYNNLMNPSSRGGRVGARVVLSYIFDYAIIIALAIAYGAIDKIVHPFQQPFSLTNIYLKYPMAVKERVPIWLAITISGGGPFIIIVTYTMIIDGMFSHHKQPGKVNRYTFRERLWQLNCGVLGLLLSQGAAFVITGTLKNLIGRPRPDLISRCQPPANAEDPLFGLSIASICTQTDFAIMQDGFRSFPSGHSSSSFAGLFYLSLYLAAKLHVLDQRGEVWRTTIILIPTLIASIIASTRIMDARHHPFDVLFGSALGILVAWGSYRQYFPPVSHTWLHGRAYPIRVWGVQLRDPNRPDRTADIVTEHPNYEANVSMEPLTYTNGRTADPREQKPYSYIPASEEREMMPLPGSSTLNRRPLGQEQVESSGSFPQQQRQDPRLRSLSPPSNVQQLGRQSRGMTSGVESLSSSDDERGFEVRTHQPRMGV